MMSSVFYFKMCPPVCMSLCFQFLLLRHSIWFYELNNMEYILHLFHLLVCVCVLSRTGPVTRNRKSWHQTGSLIPSLDWLSSEGVCTLMRPAVIEMLCVYTRSSCDNSSLYKKGRGGWFLQRKKLQTLRCIKRWRDGWGSTLFFCIFF